MQCLSAFFTVQKMIYIWIFHAPYFWFGWFILWKIVNLVALHRTSSFALGKVNILLVLPTFSVNTALWCNKDCAWCYYLYVIMHAKDPQLFAIRIGHCFPMTGFCLICSMHVLNGEVKMISWNLIRSILRNTIDNLFMLVMSEYNISSPTDSYSRKYLKLDV